jgi:glutaredoxin|tara:strand:+ start:396 stop:773 length:378 start_codon:yes stop_codon:yes gene_type:complete
MFTGFSKYEKIIKTPDDIQIKPLKTDKVVVLSREQCPFCTQMKEKLQGYTNYTIINYKPDGSLEYGSEFSNMSIDERESITNTTNKFIQDSKDFGLYFPTILYGSETVIGLPTDNYINKIFKKTV